MKQAEKKGADKGFRRPAVLGKNGAQSRHIHLHQCGRGEIAHQKGGEQDLVSGKREKKSRRRQRLLSRKRAMLSAPL